MRKAIAIDFDGCICKADWPHIGEPNMGVISAAIREQQSGAALILWTCRVGERLEEAIQFCKRHGLEFDAVNDNLPERVSVYNANPRKVNADEYWDDLAVVVPYRPIGQPATRFDRIRACQTPEEMAVELNANGRRFCPKEYSRKEPACAVPCGECIAAWLREEARK